MGPAQPPHSVHPRQRPASGPLRPLVPTAGDHAVAHGTRMPEYPEYVDREYIEQACVEYAADFYAEQGRPWYPFGDD